MNPTSWPYSDVHGKIVEAIGRHWKDVHDWIFIKKWLPYLWRLHGCLEVGKDCESRDNITMLAADVRSQPRIHGIERTDSWQSPCLAESYRLYAWDFNRTIHHIIHDMLGYINEEGRQMPDMLTQKIKQRRRQVLRILIAGYEQEGDACIRWIITDNES